MTRHHTSNAFCKVLPANQHLFFSGRRNWNALPALPHFAGQFSSFRPGTFLNEITVDLMTSACGVTYADGKDDVTIRTISGIETPFASRALMIRLKQGNREKDRIDLEYLLSEASVVRTVRS